MKLYNSLLIVAGVVALVAIFVENSNAAAVDAAKDAVNGKPANGKGNATNVAAPITGATGTAKNGTASGEELEKCPDEDANTPECIEGRSYRRSQKKKKNRYGK